MSVPPEESILEVDHWEGIESLKLGPEEVFVVTRVDGKASLKDIARIVGYDQIPTKGLGGDVPAFVPEPRRELRERLRDALAAAGMQEVIGYSLTPANRLDSASSTWH